MPSDVFFHPLDLERADEETIREVSRRLLKETGFPERIESREYVAVKLHFGEKGNRGHVPPAAAKGVVEAIGERGARAFLTDTNTLYTGQRSNSVDHLRLAEDHGFTAAATGAPVIIADGLLGDDEVVAPVPGGKHFTSVSIAREISLAGGLVTLNHMTGHLATGFGCVLKNIGMGCATRKGKMVQHSSMKPRIKADRCSGCENCVVSCPEETITLSDGVAVIDSDGCSGCGQCLAVCLSGAVLFDWNASATVLQERMVEFAAAVLHPRRDRSAHLTFLTRITANCDCMARDEPVLCGDIGVLSSLDPVALDQAGVDLVRERTGRDITDLSGREGFPVVQLDHAAAMGLGSRDYRLERLA